MTPAPDAAPADFWGPGWIALPGRSARTPRADLKPCPCGEPLFLVTEYPAGRAGEEPRTEGRTVCPICVRPRPGELILGTLDGRTGAVVTFPQPRLRTTGR